MNQLGKYQLVAEIARGGMGIVYLAVAHGPARFSKLLVVKELKPELVEDTAFLEMFLEEARLSARLNHPHIVQTYEIGSEGNHHFMVMDYLEGVTLSRIVRKRNPDFTLPMHLRALADVLSGLQYAHTLADFDGTPLGIVHRDATPQNVFLTYDGQVKLVDFGIAKALDSGFETRTGILKGKPAYMAPEQIKGAIDPRSDVFSVGVMLWEAIAGRRLFHRKGDVEVLAIMLQGDIPKLGDVKPDAPAELLRITERAMARTIDDRYQSAADFRNDIEAYLLALGPHQAARDIGTVVAAMFAEERAAVRATVEAHLNAIKAGTPQARLPSIRPHAMDSLHTPSGSGSGRSSSSSVSIPSSPSSASSFSSPHSAHSGVTETKLGATIPIDVPVDVSLPAARSNNVRSLLIGAACVGLAGFAFARWQRTESGAAPKQDSPGTAANAAASTVQMAPPVAAAPVAAPTSTTRILHVRVSPPTATIAIDGTSGGSSVDHTCIVGESLFLRATAQGYAPYERQLTCDTNADIEFSLAPAWGGGGGRGARASKSSVAVTATAEGSPPPSSASPAVAAPVPGAPTASPTATSNDVLGSGGTRPNRPIETANPYGN